MKSLKSVLLLSATTLLFTCAEKEGPKEIIAGTDQCDECTMTITNPKYATQLITAKGEAYKFDDINCMRSYEETNPEETKGSQQFVADFPSGNFIDINTATLIRGGSIKSPMGGNTQAFKDKAAATKAAADLGATVE